MINSGGLSSECKQVKKNQITLCPQQNKWRKKLNNMGCFLELTKQMVCTFCLLPTFWTPGGANVRGTLVFVCFWQCYHLAMYFCSVLVNYYVITTVIKSQLWLRYWIMDEYMDEYMDEHQLTRTWRGGTYHPSLVCKATFVESSLGRPLWLGRKQEVRMLSSYQIYF